MSRKSAQALSSGALTYMINHVFLPPKLPQESDISVFYESIMLDFTLDCLSEFKSHIGDHRTSIDAATAMITRLRDVRDAQSTTGAINETKLFKALEDLCRTGGTIPLHLRAQNCGALISNVGSTINFEAFELSPINEAVISTKGRLRRSFPGPAISVDLKTFEQASFLSTAAHTLAKMSHQAAIGTVPQVAKAGRMHNEHRDTTHPMVVTELFAGFLRAVGRPAYVSRLWKNTREEVMWQNSKSISASRSLFPSQSLLGDTSDSTSLMRIDSPLSTISGI